MTLMIVNTMFETDWVIIIPHNGTFSNHGRKPPFSVILWPLEGKNIWATWPKSESILNTHPISLQIKSELDCVNTVSHNGWKPPFLVILSPLEGQNLANVVQRGINFEHSPNKFRHQIWIGLHEYKISNRKMSLKNTLCKITISLDIGIPMINLRQSVGIPTWIRLCFLSK